MIFLIFIILFFFIFQDARFIQKQAPEVYQKYLRFPPWRWGIYGSLAFFILLPLYLRRRTRAQEELVIEEQRWFTFEAVNVFLKWMAIVLSIELGVKALEFMGMPLKDSLGSALMFVLFESWLMLVLIHRSTIDYEGGWKAAVAWLKPRRGFWPMVSLGVFSAFCFAYLAAMALLHRSVAPATPMMNMMDQNQSPGIFVLFLVMALLLAPLIEELIFRGYFFQALSQSRGRWWAIGIISIIFAVLHVPQYWGDWLAVSVVALVGLQLTLLRYTTDSVLPGVWMHYAYNISVVVIPVVFMVSQNPLYIQYLSQHTTLQIEKRIELLEQSIEDNPGFSEVYFSLANEYHEAGESLKALRYVETALVLSPGRKMYEKLKTQILEQHGPAQRSETQ